MKELKSFLRHRQTYTLNHVVRPRSFRIVVTLKFISYNRKKQSVSVPQKTNKPDSRCFVSHTYESHYTWLYYSQRKECLWVSFVSFWLPIKNTFLMSHLVGVNSYTNWHINWLEVTERSSSLLIFLMRNSLSSDQLTDQEYDTMVNALKNKKDRGMPM